MKKWSFQQHKGRDRWLGREALLAWQGGIIGRNREGLLAFREFVGELPECVREPLDPRPGTFRNEPAVRYRVRIVKRGGIVGIQGERLSIP